MSETASATDCNPPSAGASSSLVPVPEVGRVFAGDRRVRLGDVDPSGRLRLDSLTRYTQDVSNDDTTDAGLTDDLAWVVRKTTVEVWQDATFGEDLHFRTFCGGLGPRWAERRLAVRGRQGAHYEVATLWVQIDSVTGRPKQLSEQFKALYGEAALGREVGARLHHSGIPEEGTTRRPWPLRAVDFDTFNHMNNAAYWAVVEESLASDPMDAPFRSTVEYGRGIEPGHEVTIFEMPQSGGRLLWWSVDGTTPASGSLLEIDGPGAANSGAGRVGRSSVAKS